MSIISPLAKLRIDIVSDVVCPWCFIGKHRLERALARRPGLPVAVTWRAFQLNPEAPPGGIERGLAAPSRGARRSHAARFYEALAEAGAAEGIAFNFAGIRRTPNSKDAHRLIRYAAAHGRGSEMVEAMFRAHFCEGLDIGDRDALAEIAAAHGLERRRVATWLASGAGAAEVMEEDASARRLGISGVPCFIVEGSYAISGAQEPEFFLPIFDLALNEATG
jgi:predicted DsbA family dithiol-disulfide isomerase